MEPSTLLRDAVLVAVAYLSGSIPVGVLVARLSGGPDPRTVGSGRTGGTNALRALGRKWAAVVVSGDLLKGALPIVLALDANHDRVIDSNEIANASSALLTLDKNGDGKLTADEYLPPVPADAPKDAPRPFAIESRERVADPRAARPVDREP